MSFSAPRALVNALLGALLTANAFVAQAVQYTVSDLGAFLPAGNSLAAGLNSGGQVVGQSYDRHVFGAALFRSGRAINVAQRDDIALVYSHGTGINNRGKMTGYALTSLRQPAFAFIEDHGTFNPIASPPGLGCGGYAINDQGSVAANCQGRAYLYEEGRWTPLPLPRASLQSIGRAINGHGLVVGDTLRVRHGGNVSQAALWRNGVHHALPGMSASLASTAHGVSESGDVVGGMRIAAPGNPYHAYVFQAGRVTDLDNEAGSTSDARAINRLGQIVGHRSFAGRSGAYVTEASAMTWIDDLLAPGQPHTWHVQDAVAINDKGQIAATAENELGRTRAVLLTPLP